jgi:eukaryotic-like serine/threonine-protein kinase
MDRRLQYAPSMTQSTGHIDQLERYTIDRKLSEGGMAEVYLAHRMDAGCATPVVIKGVLPSFCDNDDFVRMMRNEARIAQSLCHPNIVRVEDVVEASGRPFIVMEYLDGRNLHELLHRAATKQHRLSHAFICSVVVKMLAGLGHAHESLDGEGRPLGLIHRDISLANVIVTWSGRVTVIDFGVAKATSSEDQNLTRVGQVKGKTAYMSPEQVRREPLDCRSDLFSVGIVLWEMLAQRRLFARKQWMDSMMAICFKDAAPPSMYAEGLPPALDRICAKALTRDRAGRYQSAAEMRADLEAVMAEQGWSNDDAVVQADLARLFPEESAAVREPEPEPMPTAEPEPAAEAELEAEIVMEAEHEPDMPALYAGDEDDTGEIPTTMASLRSRGDTPTQRTNTLRSLEISLLNQRLPGPSVYDDWYPHERDASVRRGGGGLLALVVIASLLAIGVAVALPYVTR